MSYLHLAMLSKQAEMYQALYKAIALSILKAVLRQPRQRMQYFITQMLLDVWFGSTI